MGLLRQPSMHRHAALFFVGPRWIARRRPRLSDSRPRHIDAGLRRCRALSVFARF